MTKKRANEMLKQGYNYSQIANEVYQLRENNGRFLNWLRLEKSASYEDIERAIVDRFEAERNA